MIHPELLWNYSWETATNNNECCYLRRKFNNRHETNGNNSAGIVPAGQWNIGREYNRGVGDTERGFKNRDLPYSRRYIQRQDNLGTGSTRIIRWHNSDEGGGVQGWGIHLPVDL